MGIYTSNNYFGRNVHDYAAEIPANEAYDAAFGCAHVLADCQANDMALFESTIYSDMNEVMAVQEGVQVVNENAFTNVIKKIVEMFKKLIAKIKGIFKAFLAKLEGLFKNGKDLVKKYEKQILKCSNWKKFKCKIRKPRSGKEDIASYINNSLFSFNNESGSQRTDRYILTKDDLSDWNSGLGASLEDAEKIKKADAEDIKEALLKLYIKPSTVSVSDYKDFSNDVTEYLYEDEDTIDGDDDNVSSSTFTANWIKGVLNEKKLIENAEKLSKKLDDEINGIIDDLNKTHNNLIDIASKDTGKKGMETKVKLDSDAAFGRVDVNKDSGSYQKKAAEFKTDAGGTEASKVQPIIIAMQKVASNEQEVITKVTSEYMAQLKFAVSQARKMWTAAAAYSSTEHKEDASYYLAVGECAAEQAYQKFESIH